jgi:hypothetical protein
VASMSPRNFEAPTPRRRASLVGTWRCLVVKRPLRRAQPRHRRRHARSPAAARGEAAAYGVRRDGGLGLAAHDVLLVDGRRVVLPINRPQAEEPMSRDRDGRQSARWTAAISSSVTLPSRRSARRRSAATLKASRGAPPDQRRSGAQDVQRKESSVDLAPLDKAESVVDDRAGRAVAVALHHPSPLTKSPQRHRHPPRSANSKDARAISSAGC